MRERDLDVDVLVVGCGPVGAFLCALLRCHGVASVLCVERERAVYPYPRAVALDAGVLRLLGRAAPQLSAWAAAHVLPAALDVRTGPPGAPGAYSVVGPFAPRSEARSGGCYPELSFFHQPSLEAALRQCAFGEGAGARLVEGAEVGGLQALTCAACLAAAAAATAGAAGAAGSSLSSALAAARPHCPDCRVSALVTPTPAAEQQPSSSSAPAPAAPQRVRARWVIGCDGGSSGVRRAAGLDFVGSSYPDEPWLVLDVASTDAALAHAWQCFNFVCHPERTYVHCPLPNAGRRFEFLLKPGEAPARMLQPEVYSELLARAAGVDARRLRVLRAVVYTFHARRASAWRRGRVALAGDAAHCMPPFRGQGMCSGLRDGAALAWRLAALMQGGRGGGGEAAARQLADSYQLERLAHVTRVTDLSIQLGSLISLSRPAWLAHARNAALGAINHALPALRPLLIFPTGPLPYRQAEEGLFDFGGGGGGGGGGARAAEPFPNAPVLALVGAGGAGGEGAGAGAGAAAREPASVLLDEAVWRAAAELRRRRAGSGGAASALAPWALLLSPAAAVLAPGSAAGAALAGALQRCAGSVAVLQVLPPTGAVARMQAHAAWVAAGARAQGKKGGEGDEGGGDEPWWRHASGAVGDRGGAMGAWMEAAAAGGALAVLLRPDGLVYSAYGAGAEEGARLGAALRVAASLGGGGGSGSGGGEEEGGAPPRLLQRRRQGACEQWGATAALVALAHVVALLAARLLY